MPSPRPAGGWPSLVQPCRSPTLAAVSRDAPPLVVRSVGSGTTAVAGPDAVGRDEARLDEAATTVLERLPPAGQPHPTDVLPLPGGERSPRRLAHPVRQVLGGLVLLVLAVVGWSLGHALGKNNSDPLVAKTAEWARDHHLGPVVSFLEQRQYDLNKPRTGGTVAGGARVGGDAPLLNAPTSTVTHARSGTPRPRTPLPAPLRPFGSAVLDEGRWRTLASVGGRPALLGTALKPDTVHTSYLATVAWMDPRLLRLELRPGTEDPGATFPRFAPRLEPGERDLVADFNAGFRLTGESQGGFYLDGVESRTLRDGAASLVIRRDGTATVGQWGRDVGRGPQVLAVRQNLKLLVDAGTVAPTVDDGNSPTWGFTLYGTNYQWRSAVGVTAAGALLYVDGPALSTRTLAEVLVRAGAVRAMELDINPQWTHFDYFPDATGGAAPQRLNDGQQTPPDHYLVGNSSRDFFAVFARVGR